MHVHEELMPADARKPSNAHQAGPDAAPVVISRATDSASVLDLQRTAGNAAVVQLLGEDRDDDGRSPVLDVVRGGGGSPMDARTRTGMETGLGADFSDVRIHSDGAASASAKAVQAHAYTVGNSVVFQSGMYQPDTPTGQRTLAHELTHVMQQRSGPVDGTPTDGGISVSDPSDRFERAAEANADRFMSQGSATTSPVPATAGVQRVTDDADTGIVQRADEKEEEEVQGMFIQRAGPEEEEDQAAG